MAMRSIFAARSATFVAAFALSDAPGILIAIVISV
jgi:hypothetical protein